MIRTASIHPARTNNDNDWIRNEYNRTDHPSNERYYKPATTVFIDYRGKNHLVLYIRVYNLETAFLFMFL